MRYAQKQLCAECFSRFFERRAWRTVKNSNLFRRGDKIGAAVSGGKDSLVLLHLLHKWHFNPVAIAIDEGIRGYRKHTLGHAENFCSENKIPVHVFSFQDEYGITIDKASKKKKAQGPCAYCGVFRRDLLNKKARALGCDRLATGHNLDDEAQTVLMNFFRGEFSRMARGGAVTGLVQSPGFVQRVKPLLLSPERENVAYALINGIEYSDAECPHARTSYRASIRDALNSLEEKYPGTKFALLRSHEKSLPMLKAHFGAGAEVGGCGRCGEPSGNAVCEACKCLGELRG